MDWDRIYASSFASLSLTGVAIKRLRFEKCSQWYLLASFVTLWMQLGTDFVYIFLSHFKDFLRPVLHGFCFLHKVGVNSFRILFHKEAFSYLADIIHKLFRVYTVRTSEIVNILILRRLNVTIPSASLVFIEQLF